MNRRSVFKALAAILTIPAAVSKAVASCGLPPTGIKLVNRVLVAQTGVTKSGRFLIPHAAWSIKMAGADIQPGQLVCLRAGKVYPCEAGDATFGIATQVSLDTEEP